MTLHSHHKDQLGLTLLETMISISILMLMVGIASVSYKKHAANNNKLALKLESISERIQSNRLKAISQGANQIIPLKDIIGEYEIECAASNNDKIIFHKNGIVTSDPFCIILPNNIKKIMSIDWVTGDLQSKE